MLSRLFYDLVLYNTICMHGVFFWCDFLLFPLIVYEPGSGYYNTWPTWLSQTECVSHAGHVDSQNVHITTNSHDDTGSQQHSLLEPFLFISLNSCAFSGFWQQLAFGQIPPQREAHHHLPGGNSVTLLSLYVSPGIFFNGLLSFASATLIFLHIPFCWQRLEPVQHLAFFLLVVETHLLDASLLGILLRLSC